MQIFLRDRSPAMVNAWTQVLGDLPKFRISEGDIFDGLLTDAIISPANSFGFMNGGIDAVYSRRWPHLQGKLQEHLLRSFHGELPVGKATVLPITENLEPGDFHYLISTPTMRVPQSIQGTVNAYLAFRAALLAAKDFNSRNLNSIKSILCPGLGTAIGKLDPLIAAQQMRAAWQSVNAPAMPEDLAEAWRNHEQLRRGLQDQSNSTGDGNEVLPFST